VVAGAAAYEVLDVGPDPGEGSSVITSVNNRGTVAGFTSSTGFVWSGGVVTLLPVPPGQNGSSIAAINNKQVVAGSSLGGPQRATQWKRARPKPLRNPAGVQHSWAEGINDKGLIVGGAVMETGGHVIPILWTGGKPKALPTLSGATYSVARTLNSRGQIIGNSGSGSNSRAVLWEGKRLTELAGLPGYTATWAADIDETGSMIVGCVSIGQTGRAAVWINRVPYLLPDLGGSSSCANAVNRRGVVAGAATLPNGAQRATLWRGEQLTDLNTLLDPGSGWDLRAAYDVNDAGWVVGYGSRNGTIRGFLLRPIAPPTHPAG
jgi:uncharacterized membrane protein